MHLLNASVAIIGIGDVVLCGSRSVLATILMEFTPEKKIGRWVRGVNGHGVKPEHRARRPLTGQSLTALRLLRRGGFRVAGFCVVFYFCCFRPASAVRWRLLVRLRNRLFRARERVAISRFTPAFGFRCIASRNASVMRPCCLHRSGHDGQRHTPCIIWRALRPACHGWRQFPKVCPVVR